MRLKTSLNAVVLSLLSTLLLAACRQRLPEPGEPVANPPADVQAAAREPLAGLYFCGYPLT